MTCSVDSENIGQDILYPSIVLQTQHMQVYPSHVTAVMSTKMIEIYADKHARISD